LVGIGFITAGVILPYLMDNPLAGFDIIDINSGADLGILNVIILFLHFYFFLFFE